MLRFILFVIVIFTELIQVFLNGCEQVQPTNEKDCFTHDGTNLHDSQCCYYTPVSNSSGAPSLCKSIPFSARIKSLKYEVVNNELYEVKCSENSFKEDSILSKCAEEVDPSDASLKKCKKYSSFVDSCCYFDRDDQPNWDYLDPKPTHGCYWLGSKYKGKITWAGMKLKCAGGLLKFQFYLIFLLLLYLM